MGERGREKDIFVRNIDLLPPEHIPTGDQPCTG